MRLCSHCHSEIPCIARSDAQYCSTRCRVAHHRAAKELIPQRMRLCDRWVRHSKKRPIQANGSSASSTDPQTWTTYAAACVSKRGDGLGFALNGDGIVCIDLDHCITNGKLSPLASFILGSTPPTYIEVSPSGTGLHIWGYTRLTSAMIYKGSAGNIEVYGNGRYMTVTGRRYKQAPATLANLSNVVALIARIS